MKPQALQDAIKVLALKKKEKGEWKDPYVKKYTITKEDYLREKLRNNPIARSLEEPSSSAPSGDSAMLSQMRALLEQMQAEKYDWKKERDTLLNEMRQVKSQINNQGISSSSPSDNNKSEEVVSSLRAEVNSLKLELEQFKKMHAKEMESLRQELTADQCNNTSSAPSSVSNSEIEGLRQELYSLRSVAKVVDELKNEISQLKTKAPTETPAKIVSQDPDDIDGLRTELSQLKTKMVDSRDIIEDLRKEIAQLKVTEKSTSSTSSKVKVVEPQSSPKTPLKSPLQRGKEKSTLPSCKPHSVQELSDRQRKDKLLKEYLLSKTGLPYSFKSMSIPDYKNEEGETKHLVCFENRLYIPKKLRELTMEYYIQHHPYDSYTTMERHCTWPDCEAEMKEYKTNRS